MFKALLMSVALRVLTWLGALLAKEIAKGLKKRQQETDDAVLLAKLAIASTKKQRVDAAANLLKDM